MRKFDNVADAFDYINQKPINNFLIEKANFYIKPNLEDLNFLFLSLKNEDDENAFMYKNLLINQRIFSYDGLFDITQENNEYKVEHYIVNQFENVYKDLQERNISVISLMNPLDINIPNTNSLIFNKKENILNLKIIFNKLNFYCDFKPLFLLYQHLLMILCTRLNLELGNIEIFINEFENYKEIKTLTDYIFIGDYKFYDIDAFNTMFDIEIIVRIQNTLADMDDLKKKIESKKNTEK